MKKLIVLSILGLFLGACDSDKFTKDIDIPMSDDDRILVINATYFAEIDTQIVLTVAEGYFINEEPPYDIEEFKKLDFNYILRDETNNVELYNGSCSQCNVEYIKVNDGDFIPGNSYSMSVSVNGHETTRAECVMPIAADLEIVDVETMGNYDEYRMNLRLTDNSDDSEYYQMSYRVTGFFQGQMGTLSLRHPYIENALFNDTYRDQVLPDRTFSKSSISFSFDEYLNYGVGDSIWIDMYATAWTEEYFRFDRSLLTVEFANDFPLSEPSTIYSNFDNSFGIFAIGSTGSDRVTLK